MLLLLSRKIFKNKALLSKISHCEIHKNTIYSSSILNHPICRIKYKYKNNLNAYINLNASHDCVLNDFTNGVIMCVCIIVHLIYIHILLYNSDVHILVIHNDLAISLCCVTVKFNLHN